MTEQSETSNVEAVSASTASTENQLTTDVSTETDAGAASATEGEGAAAATTVVAVEPPPSAKPAQDWRDKRIAKLTAQLRDLQSKTGHTAVAGAPAAPPPAAVVAMPGTKEFDALVEERAEVKATAKAATIAFNEACNQTAAKGRESFSDFDSRVQALQQLVNPADVGEAQAYNNFLFAAMETGDGARVLHALGGNLDEAERILALPPVKMGIELAKLALGKGPDQAISNAPKPITPVGTTRSSNARIDPTDTDNSDRLSTAEWMKRRNEQEDARRKRA
jgi:hypothetical protein